MLAIVVGGIVGFNMFRDQAIEQFFANMQAPPVTVSTMEVEPVTWNPGIMAIGTVGASKGVDLTVETTGVVRDILFDANQHVEKGTVLVQLDDDVQRADLNSVEAQAALDRQTLERVQQLRERGVNSQVSVTNAQATAAVSAALSTKAQAVLDQKQVKAPFSGTTGIPRVDPGQYVSPGTVIATLQDLDTMRVDFTVPEQRFDDLEIGQNVVFGITADDMPFTGSITGIDPKVDPVTRMVSVRAIITNPDGKLNPGQFVQVRVKLPEEENILAIPQTALITSLYGDYVYRVSNAEDADGDAAGAEGDAPARLIAKQIFVKPGRRSRGWVEIAEGVSAGDTVVTAGQNRLSNGATVTVDNAINPGVVATGNTDAE
nr:efflux RND transporter periplasmic adaptor subunit [Flavimaribacter sediminis]